MISVKSLTTAARLLPLLVLALAGGQACRKDPPGHAAAAASVATAAASASATPGTGASGPKPYTAKPLTSAVTAKLYSGKCPNWVHGAQTRIEDTSDGMLVFVTAEAAPAVAEIRSRAHYLAEGKSKGGDGTGRCPVPRNAVSEAVDIEHGARLTVRASTGRSPTELQAYARALVRDIPSQ